MVSFTYQTERAKLVHEPLFGDLNANLGEKVICDDIQDISGNGKLLNDFLSNSELVPLNSEEKCKGTFTRINNKNHYEKSVLEYVFCSSELHGQIASVKVDREDHFWRPDFIHIIVCIFLRYKASNFIKKVGCYRCLKILKI